MRYINEEKLKNTLRNIVDDNSSSMTFFDDFDASKPSLNFDRNEAEVARIKVAKKKRIYNIQIFASAACILVFVFSIINSDFDFYSLTGMNTSESPYIEYESAESGGMEESAAITADFFSAEDSLEPPAATPAEDSPEPPEATPAEDFPEHHASDVDSHETRAKSIDMDEASSSEIDSAEAPAYEIESNKIMADETDSGEQIQVEESPEEEAAIEDSESINHESKIQNDITQAAGAIDGSTGAVDGITEQIDESIMQKEANPSPIIPILSLFGIAILLAFVLATAKKNDESRLYSIFALKPLRITASTLIVLSILAGIIILILYLL